MTTYYRCYTIVSVVAVSFLCSHTPVVAFLLERPLTTRTSRNSPRRLVLNEIPAQSLDGSTGGADGNDLLERAARLRKEIQELERQVTSTPRPTTNQMGRNAGVVAQASAEFTDIADSVWSLTYRFSDVAEPSEDATAPDRVAGTEFRRRFYRGKVLLRFRSDGYTEMLNQESFASFSESSPETADIVKVWGWDVEESDEPNDGPSKYLLFSMDVKLSQPNGETSQQRIYFQARQNQAARSQLISLSEGSVTIKSDLIQKSVRWGFFSPAGIMAQFRDVGEFIAKPTIIQ